MYWKNNKIKLFISHRDHLKVEAKKLGNGLESFGFDSFVAHESITPTKKWKDEIFDALSTMDGFIAFLSKDFYESAYCVEELGFAYSRNIPILLYSYDGSDPKGFTFDTQAIKKGETELNFHLKESFRESKILKRNILDTFKGEGARSGFEYSKCCLASLIGLKFSDDEITEIVESIVSSRGNNQHRVLLSNERLKESLNHEEKAYIYEYYHELLSEEVLAQHSKKRYKVEENDRGGLDIIDNGHE